MTITEFLLARIAEDETTAQEAIDHPDQDLFDSPHQARWWPPRVLAECEAKRRIVELHQPFEPYGGLGVKCEACADNVEADYDGTPMTEWPCPTLRHLASVYADHPDFDPAWRP